MSGGFYNYAYNHVIMFEEKLRENLNDDPLRARFADHLALVAEAMRTIEWVDSGDYPPGDEHEEIRVVLSSGTMDQ